MYVVVAVVAQFSHAHTDTSYGVSVVEGQKAKSSGSQWDRGSGVCSPYSPVPPVYPASPASPECAAPFFEVRYGTRRIISCPPYLAPECGSGLRLRIY